MKKKNIMESYFDLINRLLEAFYRRMLVTITLYDKHGVCIAHRGGGKDFCRYVKYDDGFRRGCGNCDKNAIKKCRKDGKCREYFCHMGVRETIIPLFGNGGEPVGFLVAGKYRCKQTMAEAEQILMKSIAHKPKREREVLRAAFNALPILDEAHAQEIVPALERLVEELSASGCVSALCNDEVHAVADFIRGSKGIKMSNDQLYGILRRSRHASENFFKKYCRETPARFIAECKLITAEDRLMNTKEKISVIASDLGYSYSSFITFFKRECGITPGQLRKHKHFKDKDKDIDENRGRK